MDIPTITKKTFINKNFVFYSVGWTNQIAEKAFSNYDATAFLRLFLAKYLI